MQISGHFRHVYICIYMYIYIYIYKERELILVLPHLRKERDFRELFQSEKSVPQVNEFENRCPGPI
jgi:hypothetical protein